MNENSGIKEKELSVTEAKILEVIAYHYPISYEDVKECYEKLRSFDKILAILKISMKVGLNFKELVNKL